VNNLVLLH